jgi:DNA-binding NarL/FixJ family response regulator
MSEARPVRVVIADADRSSRAGVRLSLNAGGFHVCAEADDAETAVACARRERPDVCLIEPELSGDGVAAAARIVEEVPETAVVMLGREVDDERLLSAVVAGARGYLLKDMDPARLPQTLHGVLDGEAAIPRRLVGRVLEGLRSREHGVHASRLGVLGVDLTRRERDVLELLDRGLRTREIGDELSISSVTVRRHVSEILRKLGAPDREAALRALRGAGD